MDVIKLAEVRETPLSADEVQAAVAGPVAGGIALFLGAVRDHDHGRSVTGLGYTAHPTAGAELRRAAEKVAAGHDVLALAVLHRTGDLQIGDLAVIVAASAVHRADALDACHALIDEVKASVPVWKHQRFTGGDSEWVNCA